ncbi:MAG: endoglucanase [Sulfolobales archaeon]
MVYKLASVNAISKIAAIVVVIIAVLAGYLIGNIAPISIYQSITMGSTLTYTNVATYVQTTQMITVFQTVTQMAMPITQTLTSIVTNVVTYTQQIRISTTVTQEVTHTVKEAPQIVLKLPSDNPWPMAMVDLNGDGSPDSVIAVNPWNIKSFNGSQMLIFDLGKRELRAVYKISNVDPATWTNGYPEIYAGRKPWDTTYVNGFGVQFPMKVSKLTPFLVSFYICILNLDRNMNFDIAADAWIVREEIMRNPGTPPAQGDLEIMVWLFNQNLNPAGEKIGEEVIPIILNGSIVQASFEVWRMDSVTWGGWQYIAFKPKGWSLTCGSVAYDPTIFVRTAAKYATFDISNHYLLDWEIGTEWGTYSSKGSAEFEWILRDFSLIPGAGIGVS